jgi:hypothetical protein
VADLLDPNAVSSALRGLSDVTHIFHCAYLTSGSDQYKDATDNLALLKHVVEAVEAAQAAAVKGIQHQVPVQSLTWNRLCPASCLTAPTACAFNSAGTGCPRQEHAGRLGQRRMR